MARRLCRRPAALLVEVAGLLVASATEVFDFTGNSQGPTITVQRPVVESHWTIEGAVPTENLYKAALAESAKHVIQDVVGEKGVVILRSSTVTSLEMQVLCNILPEPQTPNGANDVQAAIVNYPLQTIQTLLYSHLYAHPDVPDAVVTDLIGRIAVEKGFQSWVYRAVTILDGTYNSTWTTTRTETTTTAGTGGGGSTGGGSGDGGSTDGGSAGGDSTDGNTTSGNTDGADNGTSDGSSSDGGVGGGTITITATTISDTTTTTSTTSTTVTRSTTTTLRTTSTRTTTTVTTSSFAAAAWRDDPGGDFFSSMFDVNENPWGFAVLTFLILSVACSLCVAASRCGLCIQLYPTTTDSRHPTKVHVLKNFNDGSALPRAESLDSVTLASDGAKWAARNLRLIRVAPSPEDFIKPDVEAGLRSAAAAAAHLQHDKVALALAGGDKPRLAITGPTDGAATPNTVSTIALSMNAESISGNRSSFSLSHHSSLATPVGGRTPIGSARSVGARTTPGSNALGVQSPLQVSPRPSCGSRGVSPRPMGGSTLAPRPLGR